MNSTHMVHHPFQGNPEGDTGRDEQMEKFNIGDRVIIADKTHIGAVPYQGRRGTVVAIHPDAPRGYTVVLMDKPESEGPPLFFLDWEIKEEPNVQ